MVQFLSQSARVVAEEIYWGYFQPRTFFKSAMIIIYWKNQNAFAKNSLLWLVPLQWMHNNNRHICTINAQRRQDQVQRKIFHWSVSVFSSKERTVGSNDVKGSMATSRGLQSDVSPLKVMSPPLNGSLRQKANAAICGKIVCCTVHTHIFTFVLYVHSF